MLQYLTGLICSQNDSHSYYIIYQLFHRALSWKMTYEDKTSYGSLLPCSAVFRDFFAELSTIVA